ncbi:MAG TPA: hypothetical protein VNA14_01045 [Mycobacteriales bacterium]|nr:hypothetical protein [Mycobacteriales bacterium]
MSSARRLLLPSFVVLALALPVAAAPGTTTVPPDRGAASAVTDSTLTRTALADAVPVLLPPPPASPPRAAPRVIPAAAKPAITPQRPRTTARADRGEFRPGWESRRGETALALITYPWREMGWQITFHEARPGLLGLASEPDKHIYVFVRRSQSIRSLAFTISHEIGHAYDFTYGTGESHRRWRDLRGIPRDVPWVGCGDCSDLETPAGDFAEVFAVWQVGPADYRSRMAPLPNADQLRVLSEEFWAPEARTAA